MHVSKNSEEISFMGVKLYAFVIVINEITDCAFINDKNQEMKTFIQENDFVCVYSLNLKTEQKTDRDNIEAGYSDMISNLRKVYIMPVKSCITSPIIQMKDRISTQGL